MNFNWSDYFELAQKLLQKGEIIAADEACQRSAISRAYYAVYCETRNLVDKRGWVYLERSPDDHNRIIKYFQTAKGKNKRKVGSYLDKLRKWRNIADYDNVISEVKLNSMATKSIKSAQELLQILLSL